MKSEQTVFYCPKMSCTHSSNISSWLIAASVLDFKEFCEITMTINKDSLNKSTDYNCNSCKRRISENYISFPVVTCNNFRGAIISSVIHVLEKQFSV